MPSWSDPESVIVRTWCVYGPRAYEGQSIQTRPCVLVMRSTEKEVVELLPAQGYSWEWDWDRGHGWGLRL